MFRKEQKIGVPVGGPFLRYFLKISMSLPKMLPHSFDSREALLTELRQKFPEVFTEGQIDIEKIQNFLQSKFSDDKDRYRMTWAGRKEAIRQVQVKTTNTFVPDVEKSVDFDNTRNMFVEGDNLEVLRVLQKSYYGKVKMIYIDPPYNTGNDFVYHDDFKYPKVQYNKESGITDEDGNVLSKTSLVRNGKDQGHYHSKWLSMMFPRLYLAKNLLRKDGIIFVSIDDNELPRLRLLMDEIFGEENFVAQFVWKRRVSSALADYRVSTDHEYILAYQRGEFAGFAGEYKDYHSYKNPNNDAKGDWMLDNLTVGMTKDQRPNQFYDLIDPITGHIFHPNPNRVWAYIQTSMNKLIEEGKVYFPSDPSKRPMLKRYKSTLKTDKNPISTLIPTTKNGSGFYSGLNSEGTKLMQELFDAKIMDYPKPLSLILALISQVVVNDDIVLDFFAGSATTAHAVMKLNAEDGGTRKWICVQLDEYANEDSEAQKLGCKTVADIARERIRRAGKKLQQENNLLDVGFKALTLSESNFPAWRGIVQDESELLEQMDLFANAQQHDAKPIDLLYEVILKEGLDINIDVQLKETSSGNYYLVNQGKLAISFVAQLKPELMDAIFLVKPEKIILLESAFIGNDELKMNTLMHAQTLKIDIRVI